MFHLHSATSAVICYAALMLPLLTVSAQPAPRPFWVCVGADGERKAQDRACRADERTVSAPPGAADPHGGHVQPSAPPVIGQASQPRATAPAAKIGNPMQPILDVAKKGLGIMLLVLLAIGVTKALLVRAFKRNKSEQAGRPSRPQPRTRESSGKRTAPAPSAGYKVEPTLPTRTVPPRQFAVAGEAVSATSTSAWNLALIRELEWKRFEELCEHYWRTKGYPAHLTGPGADGGIDIVIADQQNPARTFAVAQCKSWSSKLVGVESVRALWGAKDHFNADLALFYGLSGFTPDAQAFAAGKHLKLISAEELLQQIRTLPDDNQASLLAHVTRGDYTTPTCPTCDIKMTLRTGKDGKPNFWGCNNFRRCGARPIALRS